MIQQKPVSLKSLQLPVFQFLFKREIILTTKLGGKAAPFGDTNTLLDVIAENVLDDIGGEELVREYRKTYHS